MYLSDMKVGDIGIIKELSVNDNILRRLLDLGFINNTKIKCVIKSPLNDPTAYYVRGSLIAIREDDAKKIRIEKLNE